MRRAPTVLVGLAALAFLGQCSDDNGDGNSGGSAVTVSDVPAMGTIRVEVVDLNGAFIVDANVEVNGLPVNLTGSTHDATVPTGLAEVRVTMPTFLAWEDQVPVTGHPLTVPVVLLEQNPSVTVDQAASLSEFIPSEAHHRPCARMCDRFRM